MNRVGDAGMAIAIFLMFATLGTVNFDGVFNGVGNLTKTTVLMLGLLLLLGACSKSGQFPLQAWLPDAMEGPTPVSALIHAATMVTAGVYLIARSAPIFNASPDAQTVVVASARSRCCSEASSAARRTTSSGSWPIRRCPRSATCSWASASAAVPTRWA